MTDQPRYTDDAVDEVIRAFRAGGRLDIDEDTIVLLTDAQRRRVYDALEREEFAAAGAWRTAWLAGDTDELPPCGVFVWAEAPDDLSGLDGL